MDKASLKRYSLITKKYKDLIPSKQTELCSNCIHTTNARKPKDSLDVCVYRLLPITPEGYNCPYHNTSIPVVYHFEPLTIVNDGNTILSLGNNIVGI